MALHRMHGSGLRTVEGRKIALAVGPAFESELSSFFQFDQLPDSPTVVNVTLTASSAVSGFYICKLEDAASGDDELQFKDLDKVNPSFSLWAPVVSHEDFHSSAICGVGSVSVPWKWESLYQNE